MCVDRLRSLAALAHVVPGARIHLLSATGADVVVDRTTDADLDPCAFRQVVLHAGPPGASRLHEAVSVTRVAGSVEDRGGDLFRSDTVGRTDLHWLITHLSPELARVALADCPVERDGVEIEACLLGDPALGVTVVRLVVSGGAPAVVDAVCAWAQAACLVAEVEQYARRVGSGLSEERP